MLVTVTSADVAPDARHAVIWVGIIAEAEPLAKILARIQGLQGVVQYELAQELQTKFVPRLEFRHDTTGAYVQRIDELLQKRLNFSTKSTKH